MKISEISPVTIQEAPDTEVLSLHHRMRELWALHFQESPAESAGDLNREDVAIAFALVVDELGRRKMEHQSLNRRAKTPIAQLF